MKESAVKEDGCEERQDLLKKREMEPNLRIGIAHGNYPIEGKGPLEIGSLEEFPQEDQDIHDNERVSRDWIVSRLNGIAEGNHFSIKNKPPGAMSSGGRFFRTVCSS